LEHKLLMLAINSINKINSINNSMDNFTDKDNYYHNFDIKVNNPFDMSPKQLEYINLFNYFKRCNLQLIILERIFSSQLLKVSILLFLFEK
jgi:hypothetical protein